MNHYATRENYEFFKNSVLKSKADASVTDYNDFLDRLLSDNLKESERTLFDSAKREGAVKPINKVTLLCNRKVGMILREALLEAKIKSDIIISDICEDNTVYFIDKDKLQFCEGGK